LGLRQEDLFPSKKIVVEKVPAALYPDMLAWRKKALFDEDLAILEGRSNLIGGWDTNPGISRTARLLQRVATTPEKKAAAFIRAFIYQTLTHLPADWRGDRASALRKLFRSIGEAHPDLGEWHHSVRHTLPLSIPGEFQERSFGFWKYESDLSLLMAIEASILSSGWILLDLKFEPASQHG